MRLAATSIRTMNHATNHALRDGCRLRFGSVTPVATFDTRPTRREPVARPVKLIRRKGNVLPPVLVVRVATL